MTREASTRSEVHRILVVDRSDPQRGADVVALQHELSERLRTRGIDSHEVPIAAHGKFTHATAVACVEAGYWLGLRSDTYLKQQKGDGPGGRSLVCTQGAQAVIRDPNGERDVDQRYRAEERRSALKDAPRYAEALLARDKGDGSMEAALKWAISQVGVTEHPANSNWGEPVASWIRAAGYTSGVPWCGCFANAVVMHGGVASGAGWIGYVPNIIAHARSGAGGWSWHGPSAGSRGDLPVFDEHGGVVGDHVGGAVLERLSSSHYKTVEGNTGASRAGTQSNGGCVAIKDRTTGGSFPIVGFARPPYRR